MKPNYETCQSCEMWDSINGCWANQTKIEDCEIYYKIVESDDSYDLEDNNES